MYKTSARPDFEGLLPRVILSDAKNLAPRVLTGGSYHVKEIPLESDSSLRSD